MPYLSLLFQDADERSWAEREVEPGYFADLNLDQIVDSAVEGREEYELRRLFHQPLRTAQQVRYRQEVFHDLENSALRECVLAFGTHMREMRRYLDTADELDYEHQKSRWFLGATERYCAAVRRLSDFLAGATLQSRGFTELRRYMDEYVQSREYTGLCTETARLTDALAAVQYCLTVEETRVRVARYNDEADYGVQLADVFSRFTRSEAADYGSRFTRWSDMDYVEIGVLKQVVKLYPELFDLLEQYWRRHTGYLDTVVRDFDREIQFYLAYLEYVEPVKLSGLDFCFPDVSDETKDIAVQRTYDLALAVQRVAERSPVVPNDFQLRDQERIFVVTGPNQGGKTTFARIFGQVHHLAALGCPVPGNQARLYLFDRIYTHFEKEENMLDLRGKLQDDLLRIRDIVKGATASSIIVINELLTSTTLQDAASIGQKLMKQIIELDALCVCVTFVDELAFLGPSVVSATSSLAPGDATRRTFEIVRRPADGRSYAATIADRYDLTYEGLRRRVTAP